MGFLRSWMLPVSMTIGAVSYLTLARMDMLVPYRDSILKGVSIVQPTLLFLMLLLTFCRIRPSDLRLRRWHFTMLLFQGFGSAMIAAILSVMPPSPWHTIGQGAVLCIICPTATAAVVVTRRLGGDMASVTTYTILINFLAALLLPALLPWMHDGGGNGFVSDPWMPILAGVAFMALTHFIIARGVQSGIERFSKIMMPLLLLIIGILVVCSFSMPGSSQGLKFLLKPDFSKLTASVILSAVGQAFFSLSLAMGCLCTYASYFRADTRLPKTAVGVSVIDTIVAILAGFIIFPAVFSVEEVSVDAGPGLVFITLPSVFNIAFSHLPWLGYIFSSFFYLLLLLAALTSAMSLHESVTAYVLEAFHISRKKAAIAVSVACMTLGVACSLSFGIWSDVTLFGLNIFELFDFTASKIILPIGGIIICLFTGWYLDRKLVENELTNGGTIRFRLFRLYYFIIRYVAPLAIAAVFLQEILS